MRRKRAALFSVLLPALTVAACGLWLHAQQRHYALNRQLIAALAKGDDKLALSLVNEGAAPNTRSTLTPVSSLLERVKQLFQHKPPTSNNSPTALLLACGAPWNDDDDEISRGPDLTNAPQLVQTMLQHGAQINARDKSGWTALQWAAFMERWDTASVLLQYGANVNTRAKDGSTPLILSARSPNTVRLLLEYGADVNATDADRRTPLIAATQILAPPDVLSLLLAHGADVDAQDDGGVTPLVLAARDDYNAPDNVRLLLEHGARVNPPPNAVLIPLTSAVEDGVPGAVRVLLDHGAVVNARDAQGQTALHQAVQDFHSRDARKPPEVMRNILRQLLAHGADPYISDKHGITPLMIARRDGRSDLVAMLQPAGGGSSWLHAQQSQYALDRRLIGALLHYDTKQALALVNEGADPNTRYEPPPIPMLRQPGPPHMPARINKSPTAFAIACGAHWIDDFEKDGELRTHFRVQECLPLVQEMITYGADVNDKEDKEWEGATPLAWAMEWQRQDTVKLLMQHGARK